MSLGLYSSFFLFGIANLMPWHTCSKSVVFFKMRLQSLGAAEEMVMALSSYMAVSFTSANFVAMLVLVGLRWDEYVLSTRSRVVVGAASCGMLMLLLLWIALMSTLSARWLFGLLVVVSSCLGVMSAPLFKGLLATMARFPLEITPAFGAGQAAAGIISSLTSFLNPTSPAASHLGIIIYFGTSAALFLAALFVFLFNHVHSLHFRKHIDSAEDGKEVVQLQRVSVGKAMKVFSRIWILAICLAGVLMLTIAIFSTYLSASHAAATVDSVGWLAWYVSLVFMLYDLGDLAGRWLPALPLLAFHPHSTLIRIFPWLRYLVFLPLFIFIAPVNVIGPISSKAHLSAAFTITDALYFVIVCAFGLTNGYCNTLLLMHAPVLAITHKSERNDSSLVEDAQDREVAGTIMGFFINVGLVMGALCGSLLPTILKAVLKRN